MSCRLHALSIMPAPIWIIPAGAYVALHLRCIMHLNINLCLSAPVSKRRECVPSPPIILFTLPHLCHRPPIRCYPSALPLLLSFSLLLVSLWPRELLLTRPPPEPSRPVFLPIRHGRCNSHQPSCTKKKKKPKPRRISPQNKCIKVLVFYTTERNF